MLMTLVWTPKQETITENISIQAAMQLCYESARPCATNRMFWVVADKFNRKKLEALFISYREKRTAKTSWHKTTRRLVLRLMFSQTFAFLRSYGDTKEY